MTGSVVQTFGFCKEEEFMRILAALGLTLLLSLSGLAQSTTATAVYQEGNAILDSSGNLFVVSPGRSTTGVTITGLRRSFYAPMTRVTVVPKGATSGTTVEYNGSIQVISVGPSAIYAIGTTYTISGSTVTTSQSLIALRPSLPAGPALTGFPSFALTSLVEARGGSSDFISLITETSNSGPRTATVVQFAGGAFGQVSSSTLP
jgi:hypothetical protein